MTSHRPIIVITDLDGTLLDHDTYRFDAAIPALTVLRQLHVPLILCSSKTAAELTQIRIELANKHPFVVENGSGIYYSNSNGNNDRESLQLKTFGTPRQSILEILRTIRETLNLPYYGFAEMSVKDVMTATGLTREQSQNARQREFTEPLIWLGNHSQRLRFAAELAKHDLTAVQGGRFLTISGKADKGHAAHWLRNHYCRLFNQEPIVIALGDSDNDTAMLEHADYPILVRSPAHDLPEISAENLIITDTYGPEGWNRSVLNLLSRLQHTRGNVAR